MKHCQRRDISGDIKIHRELFRATLAHDPLAQLGASAGRGDDLDFGVFFLKAPSEYRLESLGHVYYQCALVFRGLDRLLPIHLPCSARLRGAGNVIRQKHQSHDQQHNDSNLLQCTQLLVSGNEKTIEKDSPAAPVCVTSTPFVLRLTKNDRLSTKPYTS